VLNIELQQRLEDGHTDVSGAGVSRRLFLQAITFCVMRESSNTASGPSAHFSSILLSAGPKSSCCWRQADPILAGQPIGVFGSSHADQRQQRVGVWRSIILTRLESSVDRIIRDRRQLPL
jgi:hypothetical protein